MSGGRQMITLRSQIEEARKAFQASETDIVRQVQRGKIREAEGELRVQRLRAALQTLEWVQKYEGAIKARVSQAEGARS